MRRRDVVKLLAGAMVAAPYGAAGQTTDKTYRLAMLTSGPAFPAASPPVKLLMGALAEHGYKIGSKPRVSLIRRGWAACTVAATGKGHCRE